MKNIIKNLNNSVFKFKQEFFVSDKNDTNYGKND